jgi:anti-sigma B factor antagonist
VDRSEPTALGPAGEPFHVDVEPERDAARLVLVGELDVGTTGELDERLRELRTVGFRRLVLDLRKLTFIDSSGVRLIVNATTQAPLDGIDLRLIQGPEAVERVFEICGLLDALPFRAP